MVVFPVPLFPISANTLAAFDIKINFQTVSGRERFGKSFNSKNIISTDKFVVLM